MKVNYFAFPESIGLGNKNCIIAGMLDNSMRPFIKKNDNFYVEIVTKDFELLHNKIVFVIINDVFKVGILEIKENENIVILRPLNKKYPNRILTRDQSKEQLKIIGLVKYGFRLVENYYTGTK